MEKTIKLTAIACLLMVIVIGLQEIFKTAPSLADICGCCCTNNPCPGDPWLEQAQVECPDQRWLTNGACCDYWDYYGNGDDVTQALCALPKVYSNGKWHIIVPPPPNVGEVSVTISGPNQLGYNEQGTYTANTSNGSGYFTYQWSKKLDGANNWQNLGTDQTQSVTMGNTGFTLRVNINDRVYVYCPDLDEYHVSCSLTATMSGPSYLEPYEVGTFTAHPSGGYPPYDYTWYRMELCGPEPISGGVQPLRPPCNVWVHLPQFDGSQTATSSGISPGFKMRVDVEDDDGNNVSVEKTVSVGGGLQKPLAQLEVERVTPTKFTLFPNHPNPFNPETTIRYQLAEESRVSLSVYNLLGEEVKRLVDENKPAGAYSVRWDGRDTYGMQVAGGIYVTKIEALGPSGGFVQSRKMILIK